MPEEVARLRRGDSPVRRDSAPVRSLSPKKPQPSMGKAAAELAGWQDLQRMGQ